jgi:hypothetical protein
MHIKNSHSSMGKSKNSIPEWYRGLKLQTPIFVKMISQMIKKIAVRIMAEKTAFHLLMYFILFSKLYRNGIIKEAIFKMRYNDILKFEIFERHEQHPKTFSMLLAHVFVVYFVSFTQS